MSNREEYLEAVKKLHKESTDGWNDWDIWQAATSASDARLKAILDDVKKDAEEYRDECDARYQARIKDLEQALRTTYCDHSAFQETTECKACNALLTTTPDTALQKALLEARIDQAEAIFKIVYSRDGKWNAVSVVIQELRTQLAALGE